MRVLLFAHHLVRVLRVILVRLLIRLRLLIPDAHVVLRADLERVGPEDLGGPWHVDALLRLIDRRGEPRPSREALGRWRCSLIPITGPERQGASGMKPILVAWLKLDAIIKCWLLQGPVHRGALPWEERSLLGSVAAISRIHVGVDLSAVDRLPL